MPSSILKGPRAHSSKSGPILVTASYVFDWAVLIVLGVTGYIMSGVSPNKRPFYLTDPNISFPVTEPETVPNVLAGILVSAIPVGVIVIICLVFVPGPTVPQGTPQALIWRRKLWELHVGLLGLGLSAAATWFISNGMKNLYGKPRPDLLARCIPDVENMEKYIVGGNLIPGGRATALVSADICTNPDSAVIDEGFRSFPSAHSSLSAASFIYLSLFIASKFAVTIPFLPPSSASDVDRNARSAFPSRIPLTRESTDTTYYGAQDTAKHGGHGGGGTQKAAMAARRQAAAPPIYLLILALLPFFASIFIASTRWFDFRHHGFDILFGYFIGTLVSIFSFRYYHLPISAGAGWAWAPRSPDKAFWAGIGSYSYATHKTSYARTPDEEEGIEMEHHHDPRTEGLRSRENTHGSI
ncbi:related to diacylglycerol pyrophosphate phosphatase [Cephalotrichum gorgonifer]|uniref:Related to diacylglycerol pyrophosphate phosphatase n=1 Tax=Cephalotrichum gorgonifer TaxID=2041049 RepID=A0AAE8SRJ4_9PEZI|nr:related to diacylglycerol pyrophosphate phosphatase [Cephalotrichum gorgonifer]